MATVKPVDETDYVPPKNTAIGAVNKSTLLPGVTAEANAEIAAQLAPLQADVGSLEGRREAAVTDYERIFSGLQGTVEDSTSRLRQDYTGSADLERGIFNRASSDLAALSAQRSADAQNLAQVLGVSVPLEGMFRAPADFERGLFTNQAGARLLSAQQLRDNNLAAAEAFSGRVFPLIRKEEEARMRFQFNDEISKRKKEIAAIKSTKKGLINAKLRDRLVQDRQYQLDKATAQRNWWLSVKGLELERDRIQTGLAETQAQIDASSEQQTAQIGATAAENAKERAARAKLEKQRRGLNRNDLQLTQKQNIIKVVNGMVSPGAQVVTISESVPAQAGDPDGIDLGPGAVPRYIKYVDKKVNAGAEAVVNPMQIFNAVMGNVGLSRKKNPVLYQFTLKTIKDLLAAQGLNIGDWVPGQAVPYEQPSTGETTKGGKPTGKAGRVIPGRGD